MKRQQRLYDNQIKRQRKLAKPSQHPNPNPKPSSSSVPPTPLFPLPPTPQPTTTSQQSLFQSLLPKILAIDMQVAPQAIEHCFEQLTAPHLTFQCLMPKFKNLVGKRLLANGRFLRKWCEVMRANPYINYGLVLERIRERFVVGLREDRDGVSEWVDREIEMERQKAEEKEDEKESGKEAIKFTLRELSNKQNQQQKIPSKLPDIPPSANKSENFNLLDVPSHSKQSQKPENSSCDSLQFPPSNPNLPFTLQMLHHLPAHASKHLPLTQVWISGILQYDFEDAGLYCVLLVKDKQSNDESVMVLPLQNSCHSPVILSEIAEQYPVKGVLYSEVVVGDIRRYWQEHLAEMFD